MSYVLGLDLSLTGTGIATLDLTPDGTIDPQLRTEKSAPAGDNYRLRWNRLTDMTNRITPGDRGPTLVAVEGPSYGSSATKSASIHDRAGLWWSVVGHLLDTGTPVAVIPPTTRAKWATGRGNAGKSEVAVGVARLWPDVNARTEDEWDALAVASMAAQQLGWPITRRAHHAACLDTISWPELAREAAPVRGSVA